MASELAPGGYSPAQQRKIPVPQARIEPYSSLSIAAHASIYAINTNAAGRDLERESSLHWQPCFPLAGEYTSFTKPNRDLDFEIEIRCRKGLLGYLYHHRHNRNHDLWPLPNNLFHVWESWVLVSIVQWATKVVTLASIRNAWKQGSWLLRRTVPSHFRFP